MDLRFRIAYWIDRHHLRISISVWLAALVTLALVGLIATRAQAADATLNWTLPTQRVDNSPVTISELKHTEIVYGLCAAGQLPATPASAVFVSPATTGKITGLGYGTWCFAARVSDTDGLLSALTGVVSKIVLAPPKPPVLMTVAVTVYEVKIHPTQGLVAGRAVGTIALGAKCYEDVAGGAFVGADLYGVKLASVKLDKPPRSELLVAKCATG